VLRCVLRRLHKEHVMKKSAASSKAKPAGLCCNLYYFELPVDREYQGIKNIVRSFEFCFGVVQCLLFFQAVG